MNIRNESIKQLAGRAYGQSLSRRGFLQTAGTVLLGAGLVPQIEWPQMAAGKAVPSNPFIVLLKGVYQPVPAGHGPSNNLGLSTVNLNDGSYIKTRIYPVWIGLPGSQNQDKPIGTFYVQGAASNPLCAYDLPGGAAVMYFTGGEFTPHDDGNGGQYLEGAFELTIQEATGIYSAFAGGHNHMVDRLHLLADGNYDEFCFCVVSQYPFP
jgi:hypothetical protein